MLKLQCYDVRLSTLENGYIYILYMRFLFPIYTYRVVLSDITACIDDTTDIENKGWRTAYSLGNPNGQRQYHSGILASMDVSRD